VRRAEGPKVFRLKSSTFFLNLLLFFSPKQRSDGTLRIVLFTSLPSLDDSSPIESLMDPPCTFSQHRQAFSPSCSFFLLDLLRISALRQPT